MIEIPEEFYKSLKIIIKFQNSLLLREIANDNNWNYQELKKKYLKNPDVKELIDDKNKKKKIKKKNGQGKIKCEKWIYEETEYYVENETNNVYNLELNFVGIKENDKINFDMDEK
tara:strand:- start:162 stop:506 length:345 start_codon:yes stop_codon:yes gene_type:complete